MTQILFTLIGLVTLLFYLQHSMHLVEKIAGGAAWISLSCGAVKLDMAIVGLYRHKKALAAASAWRLCSWLIGTGEVWLMMYFLGLPVFWFPVRWGFRRAVICCSVPCWAFRPKRDWRCRWVSECVNWRWAFPV